MGDTAFDCGGCACPGGDNAAISGGDNAAISGCDGTEGEMGLSGDGSDLGAAAFIPGFGWEDMLGAADGVDCGTSR
jgi:hypothetical protein